MIKKKYNKSGIIKIKSVISKKQANKITHKINEIFCNVMINKKLINQRIDIFKNTNILKRFRLKYPNIFLNLKLNSIQKLPEVYEIGYSRKILKIIKKLGLKNPVYSTDPILMMHHKDTNIKGGGDYAPLHQDWRSIQGSVNCIVLWMPLVEIDTKMGSISFVEGSHLLGLLPTKKHSWFRNINEKYLKNMKLSSIRINKGDCFFFSSFLVHKSFKNKSNKVRLSLQYRYNDLDDDHYLSRSYSTNYIHAKPKKNLNRKDVPSISRIKSTYS